jgi:SAM-dependent methyltransferase
MQNKILAGVQEYYGKKVDQHGSNFLGVDWNSKESQYLRFKQLCSIMQPDTSFSLLDFGCGYGELINYLRSEDMGKAFTYFGYDISDKMIDMARTLHKDLANTDFSVKLPDTGFDYVIGSGLFNVKLNLANDTEWLTYILSVLNTFHELSKKAFSFNVLTSYSDKEHMKEYLYYADPLFLFDFCKKHFSRNVSLIHDYDLYEFTIVVKK